MHDLVEKYGGNVSSKPSYYSKTIKEAKQRMSQLEWIMALSPDSLIIQSSISQSKVSNWADFNKVMNGVQNFKVQVDRAKKPIEAVRGSLNKEYLDKAYSNYLTGN